MKNVLNTLAFYVKYPGWHSYDTKDRGTVAAVKSLVKRGYLSVNGCQAKYTGIIWSVRKCLNQKAKQNANEKDFKAIAEIVNNNMVGIDGRIYFHFDLAKELAEFLATKNPKFDRNKFLAACGV